MAGALLVTGLHTCYTPAVLARDAVIVSGVVSLAGALALPTQLADGSAFPQRDLIQFLTFWVIFATLVLQGLTLPLVIRLLGLHKRHEPPDEPPSC